MSVTRRSKRDRNANGIPDEIEEKTGRRPLRSRNEGRTTPTGRPAPVERRQEARGGGGGGGGRDSGTQSTVPPLSGLDTQQSRTPFGRSFSEDMGLDVFANPEIASNQFMRNQGMDPLRGGGMTKVMNDLAAVMPDLFFLTQGNRVGGALEGLGAPSFLDFAGEFLNNMGTPGGGYIAPSVTANLFSKADSPLQAFLNDPNADTATQINRLLGMMGAGLQTTIPPQILAAVMGQAQQAGTDFMTDLSQGNQRGSTFADALRRGTSIDDWLGI